jgi:uncharacterized membrane protein
MNNSLKKVLRISLLTIFLMNLSTKVTYAVCPVCTIAVGAGLGLSRFLGIDDLATGVWVGGFLTSLSLMSSNWLYQKDFFKKVNKIYLDFSVYLLSILLIFLPLDLANITGHPDNKILGIDKLLFGTFVGTLVFLGSIYLDKKVREKYKKQLFNYQKVVFPLVLLAIVSLIFYFITR